MLQGSSWRLALSAAAAAACVAAGPCSAAAADSSYPADLGPASLAAAAKGWPPPPPASGEHPAPARTAAPWPPALKTGYRLTVARCGRCHTPARVFNHRYAEPEGKNVPDKEDVIASLKADHPGFFQAPGVWQIEADVWKLCVERMAAMPASGIKPGEGRTIWLFLVAEGAPRKLGEGASAWKTLRESLLKRFKAERPGRYRELEAVDGL
ncbi:MAG: hypothetical protein HY927_01030 [Elusimicrobia bacterium]|nr:hypothetical protein [Elusimicrobiota bacterium]